MVVNFNINCCNLHDDSTPFVLETIEYHSFDIKLYVVVYSRSIIYPVEAYLMRHLLIISTNQMRDLIFE